MLQEIEKKGGKLEQPEACPDEIYQITMKCWNIQPSERPNFNNLEKFLTDVCLLVELF